MPKARLTEKQFIECWNRHLSPNGVSKETGMALSNINRRRKFLEKKHAIRLPVHDPNRPKYNSAIVTDDRVEVKLKISDGVILVINDIHYWPGQTPTMHRAFCHMAKKLKPFAVVINGDAFDGASNSRWAGIGWEKKPDVKEELEVCQDRLGEIFKSCGNAKRIWTLGNHDMRFETFLAANANQYKGIDGFHLKDHFPEWTPAWFVTVNDGEPSHTEIRHREKGGIHASWNNAMGAGVTIVTGHDHTADVRRIENRRGYHYGMRTGMGADSARDPQFVNYLEGRKPNTWTSAFGVLTYRNGRLMQPELALRVDENHFEFRSEIIEV
jgi:hypothetical protein